MLFESTLRQAWALASVFGLVAASSAGLPSTRAYAQSFDCRLDRRLDEQTICSDPALSRLDVLYTRNYNVARALTGPQTVDLARAFNRERAECGAARACIQSVQIRGIEALQRLGGPASVPAELRLGPAGLGGALAVAPIGGAAASASQTTQIVVQPNTAETSELKGQVAQLSALLKANQEQTAREARRDAFRPAADPDLASLDEDSLAAMGDRLEQAARNHASYSTPTRPDDRDLGRTARAASEAFPRVPFYIPGTRESGRFWIDPRVSDAGALFYDMTFVDPSASVDQRRAIIDLTAPQLERMRLSIAKLVAWSEIAHKNEVRRAYRKRVDCFPEVSCPREGEKVDGQSSTEVVFIVNEDGSTAGRIQRNKGRYDEGYNISIKSARLLASYLRYVQSRAEREFAAGTRTSADLDAMFR